MPQFVAAVSPSRANGGTIPINDYILFLMDLHAVVVWKVDNNISLVNILADAFE